MKQQVLSRGDSAGVTDRFGNRLIALQHRVRIQVVEQMTVLPLRPTITRVSRSILTLWVSGTLSLCGGSKSVVDS